jgi:hypothetical protein
LAFRLYKAGYNREDRTPRWTGPQTPQRSSGSPRQREALQRRVGDHQADLQRGLGEKLGLREVHRGGVRSPRKRA